MKGIVLGFDAAVACGHIRGEDDRRYQFGASDVRADRVVNQGEPVDFEADGDLARNIYLLTDNAPSSSAGARPLALDVIDRSLVHWRRSRRTARGLVVLAIASLAVAVFGWLALANAASRSVDRLVGSVVNGKIEANGHPFDTFILTHIAEWINWMLVISIVTLIVSTFAVIRLGAAARQRESLAADLRDGLREASGDDRAAIELRLQALEISGRA